MCGLLFFLLNFLNSVNGSESYVVTEKLFSEIFLEIIFKNYVENLVDRFWYSVSFQFLKRFYPIVA